MHYYEVLDILKKGPKELRARRMCWEDAHIAYDHDMSKVNYTRNHKFKDGTIMMTCTSFIPSLGDLGHDDWEIFE